MRKNMMQSWTRKSQVKRHEDAASLHDTKNGRSVADAGRKQNGSQPVPTDATLYQQ